MTASSAIKHLRNTSLACLLLVAPGAFGAEEILQSLEGPDITIIAGENRTVYEYRQNGILRIIKIIPSFGRPYFLVPSDNTRGNGNLDQGEGLLPSWVIVEF